MSSLGVEIFDPFTKSEEAENKDEMMELAPNLASFSPQLGSQDFSSKFDVRIADLSLIHI